MEKAVVLFPAEDKIRDQRGRSGRFRLGGQRLGKTEDPEKTK
jgi:hypothetical protein